MGAALALRKLRVLLYLKEEIFESRCISNMYLCHLLLLQLLYLFPVAFSNDSTCGALFGSNSGTFDEGDIDFKLSGIQVVSPGDAGLVFSWDMSGADPSALQIIRLLLNCSSFQVLQLSLHEAIFIEPFKKAVNIIIGSIITINISIIIGFTNQYFLRPIVPILAF